MRGGHNIKSTAEKKAIGTSQPVRDKDRLENFVKAEKTIDHPASLSDRALEKWKWVRDKLAANNLLTDADRDAMHIYAENWVLWEDLAADVAENGTVLWVETAAGKKPITNPAFRHKKECEVILRQIWDMFGFTPRSRMGIKVPEKPKQTSILELIKGGNKKAV